MRWELCSNHRHTERRGWAGLAP